LPYGTKGKPKIHGKIIKEEDKTTFHIKEALKAPLCSLKFVFVTATVDLLSDNVRWGLSRAENIVLRFVFIIAVVEPLVILTPRRSSWGKLPRVSGIAAAHGDAFGGAEEMTLCQNTGYNK